MENPALAPDARTPAPIHNELFVLSRHGISFTAKSGSLKFEGRGNIYLSTLRIVFVNEKRSSFQGFDLPLATMQRESFNQPIFGANNMTGESPALEASACQGDIKWCISFKEGGVGTFLPLFFRLLGEMRSLMAQQQQPAQPVASSAQGTPVVVPKTVASTIVQAAYIDPNDPTQLYVSQ